MLAGRILYTVQWTANSFGTAIEDMRINHRGFYIFMIQPFLDGADIVPPFEQVGSEGMGEGMRGNMFVDFSCPGCFAHCFLYGSRANVVATDDTVRFTLRANLGRENILPNPFPVCICVFP